MKNARLYALMQAAAAARPDLLQSFETDLTVHDRKSLEHAPDGAAWIWCPYRLGTHLVPLHHLETHKDREQAIGCVQLLARDNREAVAFFRADTGTQTLEPLSERRACELIAETRRQTAAPAGSFS